MNRHWLGLLKQTCIHIKLPARRTSHKTPNSIIEYSDWLGRK